MKRTSVGVLAVLVTSLLILAFGPGKVSIDYLLKRLVFREPDVGRVPANPENAV